MKNSFIAIFFCVFASISFAQSIYVDYKLIANTKSLNQIEPKEEIPNEAIKVFKEAFVLINSMKMHLEANKTEALFWGDNLMNSDVDPMVYNMAKIMVGNDKPYRTDLKTGVIYKRTEAFGKIFLIKDSINSMDWKLTKEQKKIGNYTCFKATANYWVINSAGKFKKEVIAWYSPSISYNFGPKNFSGLPGLILELTDDKIVYVMDKITFNPENIKIDGFKKGTIVSNEEFENLAQKAMEMRNNDRKKF